MEQKRIDKDLPLVSIIIPVYNVEKYLPECMESIIKQTYSKLEIILVDDGSTDKSPALCDDYALKDKRIKVIHKENGGLISAWMAGVRVSLGEYLLFVDSDDWIENVMVEELLTYAVGEVKEVICCNYIMEKVGKKKSIPVKQGMNPGIYERNEIEKNILPYLLGQETRPIHFSRCMKLISRQLVIQNMEYLNYKVTMGEDVTIILPVLLDAERIVILEEGYYYHYRILDSSMAHKYQPDLHKKIRDLGLQLGETVEKKISESGRRKLFLEALKKEYIFLMFYVLKNELRGPGKGRTERIAAITKEEKDIMRLWDTKVEVSGKAGYLLYFIWKKPDIIRVTIGRVVISIFDRV